MRPRILLLSLDDWIGAVRLPRMLKSAGFEVALLGPPDGLVAQSAAIEMRFALSPSLTRLGVLAPVLATIEAWRPRLVVPCDEASVQLVQRMAVAFEGVRAADGQWRTQIPEPVREVLLRSLGEARTFPLRDSRAQGRRVAELMGIPSPPSVPVPYLNIAEDFAATHGWPVTLVREGRSSGRRVLICEDSAALRRAYNELAHANAPPTRGWERLWWTLRTFHHLAGSLTVPTAPPVPVTVEAAQHGERLTFAFVAYDGATLAGFTARTEQTHPPGSGEPALVRLVADPSLTEAARRIIGRMGFTGFGAVEFLRTPGEGRLMFLRFAPRPPATVHLGVHAGGDLAAALYAALVNMVAPRPAPARGEVRVALFPQDWMRDPAGRERANTLDDRPTEDTRLLAALAALVPARQPA